MSDVEIQCHSCVHQEVCFHKNKMRASLDAMKDIDLTDIFEISLKCKHYKGNKDYIFQQKGRMNTE